MYMNGVLKKNRSIEERIYTGKCFDFTLNSSIYFLSTNIPLYQHSLQRIHFASLMYSICLLMSINLLDFIMLLFRPIYLSFCMGFSFWGWGGTDQHDSCYPEGRPTVVWIKSYGYRLVGKEYQHAPKMHWEGILIAYIL